MVSLVALGVDDLSGQKDKYTSCWLQSNLTKQSAILDMTNARIFVK